MTNDFEEGAAPVAFLVCFAVRQEAAHFLSVPRPSGRRIESSITGMGWRNASEGIRKAVAALRPERVLTCGFAGGLNPVLARGTVVFDEDPEAGLSRKLLSLGAVPAHFHCAPRVVITAEEKRRLRASTGADVVEMESLAIRQICRESRIPSATIRVISDAADDDLPLDFNSLMTSAHRIHYGKLAWHLLKSPRRVRRLLAFQRQVGQAAGRLGEILQHVVTGHGL